MHEEGSGDSLALPRFSLARCVRVFGLLLMLVALASGLQVAWDSLSRMPLATAALTAGTMAALATALGALPVLLTRHLPDVVRDALTGFGAGVMLAASVFSLIIPALGAARRLGSGPFEAGFIVAGGIVLGALVLLGTGHLLPTPAAIDDQELVRLRARQRTWLFVLAIVLHNVPEGLAIGVAHAAGDAERAAALTTGIAIQDVPEGFVVAMAIVAAGYRRSFAVILGMASGLVEAVGRGRGCRSDRAVDGAAAVGAGLCRRCHAVRGVPRGHPRSSRWRPSHPPRGAADRLHRDDAAGYSARLTSGAGTKERDGPVR